MKISKLLKVLFLFTCPCILNAQELTTKWTEKIQYDNKIDGFFNSFVGNNSQFVYAQFNSWALKQKNFKTKILALNKTTLAKEGELRLLGYPQNKVDKGMYFHKLIALENAVYVVWTKKEKEGGWSIYMESYDTKLKKISNLKKVYSLRGEGKTSDKLVLLHNSKAGNVILVGRELGLQEQEGALNFEYNIVSENLDVRYSGLVELPIRVKRLSVSFNPYATAAMTYNEISKTRVTYEIADNGKIYVYDVIKRDKKDLKKGESKTFPLVVQIEPSTGKSKSFEVRFENKNTFRFSTLVTKDGVNLCGFFSDLEKDPQGQDTHGIFYLKMDVGEFKPKSTRFTYFDKELLDKLYSADKEDQRKSTKSDKLKKKSDEESIDDSYAIESVQQEGSDIILFCSIMRNWSQTVCSSNGNGGMSCSTTYYCDKKNVTAFRISPDGGLVWASNLDRFYQYTSTSVYDLSVMKKNNSYYVLYNSAYQMNSVKKNRKSKKSGEQMMDRFEYATFSAATGEYQKHEAQVNAVNTPKKEKKLVNSTKIQVYDNNFYTHSERIYIKPWSYLACILVPCGPIWVIFNGNLRKGEGYLGTITAR